MLVIINFGGRDSELEVILRYKTIIPKKKKSKKLKQQTTHTHTEKVLT